MLPFCHKFSPVPHSLRRSLYVLRCRRWWRRKSSVESKARAKGKGEKAPRRVRQIHLLLPSSTPAKPSQLYNTMHYDTVPHRLDSMTIADSLKNPPRSRPGKLSSSPTSIPVRLLQVARQSNLMEDYYCQPAYVHVAVLHHPSCSQPYLERC